MTIFIVEAGGYMFQTHPLFGIFTVVEVDGYPLPCIGLSWPLTNRHLLGVASHLLSRWYLLCWFGKSLVW